MTTSATPEYSTLLTKFVSSTLLSLLRAGLPHLPPGVVTWEGYKVGTNDQYVLGSMPDLAPSLTALVEGVTPTAEDIETDTVEWTAVETGRVIRGTDRLIRQQPYGWASTVAERIARNAAESADEKARLIWQAAHAGEVTLGTGVAPLTADIVAKAVTALQERDVPTVGGLYVGIFSPRQILSLKTEVGERAWTDVAKYANPDDAMQGHLGDFGGVRFMGNSRVATTGGKAVGVIAGADALAMSDANSIVTTAILPTPSESDPLAQRAVFGWRGRWGGTVIPRRKYQTDVNPVFSFVKVHTTAPDPTV